jgi:anti-sigma B factor antagonist
MEGTDDFGIGTLIEDSGAVRLRPIGDLDLHTSPRLEEAVREQLGDGRGQVTLDLSRTSFIDSSGLGTIVRLAQVVSMGGGRLRLVSPTRQAARLFEISGVLSFLEVSDGPPAG